MRLSANRDLRVETFDCLHFSASEDGWLAEESHDEEVRHLLWLVLVGDGPLRECHLSSEAWRGKFWVSRARFLPASGGLAALLRFDWND